MTDTTRESLISRVAWVIRRCYCYRSMVVRQLSSYNPPIEKYQKFWTKAALLCITHRINPTEYIEVLFAALSPRWPEISQTGSGYALELYRKHAKEHAYSFLVNFNLQLSAFELLVKQGKDPAVVLQDEEQEFDPLFVYSVADANGIPELAKKYEEAALAKYLSSVHYDQLYKDMIPAKFKQVAAEMQEGTSND